MNSVLAALASLVVTNVCYGITEVVEPSIMGIQGARTASAEWPDKFGCDEIAAKIRPGMTRREVERLLRPYRPYPFGGGGQGGPQCSGYLLSPRWRLDIWFDIRTPQTVGTSTILGPTDRVSKVKDAVRVNPMMQGVISEDEFRKIQVQIEQSGSGR